MIKNWNSLSDYSKQSTFSDVIVSGNNLTLASGKDYGYARFRFQSENVSEWQNIEWTNTYLYRISKCKVRVRTNDTATLSYDYFLFSDDVQWTSYFVDTPQSLINILYIRNSKYIEIEIYLETEDRTLNIPIVNNINLTYRADITAPKKTETLSVWKSGRNLSPLSSR
jgi:hypothetical protein